MGGPELRRDPLSGRWALIAPGRTARPGCFLSRPEPTPETPEEARACPFCPGREDQTPPEIAAVRDIGSRPDSPGWKVRIVPNMYPALQECPSVGEAEAGSFKERRPAAGAHEVVIDSPRHDLDLDEMPLADAALALGQIRRRVAALSGRHAYVQVFKNRGREAGASLRHPHTQITALPMVPPRVAEEAARFEAWHDGNGGCLLCRLIEEESASGRRLIRLNRSFAALAPFGSAFPLETRIVPLRHAGSFSEMEEQETEDLASCLGAVLAALRRAADDPAYNLVLVQGPAPEALFHWHLDILPVLVRTAGFEWGTGVHINPVAPEEAAERLRRAGT